MKTIGMLGGMSWESTLTYYRILNEEVRRRLGGLHSARLVLLSVDFAPVEEMMRAGRWDEAGAHLAAAAAAVERAGAELLILCTNTLHKVAPAIERRVGIPFLHIVDATADAVHAQGLRRVALLGTRFTMEEPFYRERLEAAGLEVVYPRRLRARGDPPRHLRGAGPWRRPRRVEGRLPEGRRQAPRRRRRGGDPRLHRDRHAPRRVRRPRPGLRHDRDPRPRRRRRGAAGRTPRAGGHTGLIPTW